MQVGKFVQPGYFQDIVEGKSQCLQIDEVFKARDPCDLVVGKVQSFQVHKVFQSLYFLIRLPLSFNSWRFVRFSRPPISVISLIFVLPRFRHTKLSRKLEWS